MPRLPSTVMHGMGRVGDFCSGSFIGEPAWACHDRCLALRHPDDRMVYVPREGLQYIEESPPRTTASHPGGPR
jgi:hypothetical protein